MELVSKAVAALRRAETISSEVRVARNGHQSKEARDALLMSKHIITSQSQSIARNIAELFRKRKIQQERSKSELLPGVDLYTSKIVVMTEEDFETLQELVQKLKDRHILLGPVEEPFESRANAG